MDSDNPFAVSELCSGQTDIQVDQGDPHDFHVMGNLLICGQTVVLPEVCVETGETTDLLLSRQTAQYPSFKLVISQRQCMVNYYVTRRIRNQRIWRSLATFTLGLSGVLLMLAGVIAADTRVLFLRTGPILVILGLVSLVGGIVGLAWFRRSLSLVRFAGPNTYCICGFRPDELARLEAARRQEVARQLQLSQNVVTRDGLI